MARLSQMLAAPLLTGQVVAELLFGRKLRAFCVVAGALLVFGAAIALAGSPRQMHGHRYQVRVYDTLWTIASRYYGGDPREGVYRLEQRNHLAGELIRPGQTLILP